ncbi:hypothetical protein AAVH_01464 [Aphelenchoides avenae]|nr:hypothetical protein AAVH_01464 [Aphelenchus avenae]
MLQITTPSSYSKPLRLYGTVEVDANIDDAIDHVGFALVDAQDISKRGQMASERRRLLADLEKLLADLKRMHQDYHTACVQSPERLRPRLSAKATCHQKASKQQVHGSCRSRVREPSRNEQVARNVNCTVKLRMTPMYEPCRQ